MHFLFFDPYNVFLAIATNIPQRLNLAGFGWFYGPGSHTHTHYIYIYIYTHITTFFLYIF